MTPPNENLPCPEKQLLSYCARTQITPEIAAGIRKILAGPVDWDYLLWEAEENSITPLLERHLSAVAPGAAPPTAQEQLKKTCRANTVRCLYLTAELINILRLFQSQNIPVIPYKGPVLAAQAYGDVALREFEDLDIILRQSDIPKAHEIVVSLGYKPKFDWILSPGAAASLVPGEYNYRDEARRAMVELHTEITLRHFPVKPDLDAFIRNLTPVKLSDRDVLTFTAEESAADALHSRLERFLGAAFLDRGSQRARSISSRARLGSRAAFRATSARCADVEPGPRAGCNRAGFIAAARS